MSDSIKSGKIDIINCFQRLDELNLTINPNKLALLQQEIEYWGLLINQDGVKPLKDKMDALKQSTNPTNQKETLSLLSSLSYYMDRIPYLSTLAIPLKELSSQKNHLNGLKNIQKFYLILKTPSSKLLLITMIHPIQTQF